MSSRRLPPRAWIGLVLLLVSWGVNWFAHGLRTHVFFFPQWLGTILLIDGWTERRDGSSLWSRSRRAFVLLFVLSVPLWWLFEGANRILGNWEYLARESFGDLEYALWASLSFSTVVPAVLVSARWARGLAWVERLPRGGRIAPSRGLAIACLALGTAMLVATLLFPRVCYPGIWVSGVFLLEPLVLARGGRGLTRDLALGDWRPWVALWTGGLACGFLWELWNVHSWPKWVYHIPGIDGPKLFEMPLPGYLGYLPFALEVYLWKELWLDEPELLSNVVGRRAPDGAPVG